MNDVEFSMRRTFSLGRDSFESMSFEVIGRGPNMEMARLDGAHQLLVLASQEMVRIFGIRQQNTTNSAWDQVQMELQGVTQEQANHQSNKLTNSQTI